MPRTSARSVVAHALLGLALLGPRAPGGEDELLGSRIDLPDQSDTYFHRDGQRILYALTYHRPLLLLFWRADDTVSTSRAVPAALALQQDHPDDVVVVFLERSGLSQLDMLRFACSHHWLDTAALWTCDALPGVAPESLPAFVLTSPRRVVVATGDPVADAGVLAAELKWVVTERRRGAATLPAEARDAWKALDEGRLRDALALRDVAERLADRGQPGDTVLVKTLALQAGLIEGVLSTPIDLADNLFNTGYTARRLARFEQLADDDKGLPKGHPLCQRLEQGLESARHGGEGPERQASEQLVELQDRLFKTGPSPALKKLLGKLAAEFPETFAAKRAGVLAAIAGQP